MEAPTRDYGSIGWAVQHMRHGWRMRRASWPASMSIGYDTAGGVLSAYTNDGPTIWTAGQADLLANDWLVIGAPQPGETHLE